MTKSERCILEDVVWLQKENTATRNKQTLSLLTCIFVHERDYYHILPQNIILSEHRVLERDVKDFIQISDVVHVILVVGLCSWAQLSAAVREISPRSTETARVSSSQRLPWVPVGYQRLFFLARGRMRRCEDASGKAFRAVHYKDLNETGDRA